MVNVMTELQHGPSNRKGFRTLGIVALAGILVIGVAFAFAVKDARIAAQRSSDKGHLKQLAVAIHNYHDTYGQLPPPFVADAEGRPMHSWRVLILPFIDQQKLYAEYRFTEPWNSPHNRELESRMPNAYAFSGTGMRGNTTTNVLAVTGPETMWPGRGKATFDDVKDGQDHSIMFVENDGSGIHWMEPRDLVFEEMDFTLNSPAGVSCNHLTPNVATVSGYVKRLDKDITTATLRALFTINGRENIRENEHGNWQLLLE